MSDTRTSGKKPAKSDFILTFKKALLNIKALPKYFYTRYIKKPLPVRSKIVFVVSFPRSGTHAIGSLLSNEKVGFRYYGEFFIFNAWNSQIERINRFYPFFSLRYSLNLRKQAFREFTSSRYFHNIFQIHFYNQLLLNLNRTLSSFAEIISIASSHIRRRTLQVSGTRRVPLISLLT
jgi:hypothetical protein